jgi:hypothetical protein
VTTPEDEASTLVGVARSLEARATEDIERDAGLVVLRAVGSTMRTLDRVRHRVVDTLQGRPRGSEGHATWPVLADALGERQSTVYGRWERTVRRGVGPAPLTDDPGEVLAHAIDALTGTAIADATPSTALLLDAAQSSFARRRRNSDDGSAVLNALHERGMDWEEIERRTGIPVEIARNWASPPSTGESR